MVLFTELTRDVCHLKFDLPWAAILKLNMTERIAVPGPPLVHHHLVRKPTTHFKMASRTKFKLKKYSL